MYICFIVDIIVISVYIHSNALDNIAWQTYNIFRVTDTSLAGKLCDNWKYLPRAWQGKLIISMENNCRNVVKVNR